MCPNEHIFGVQFKRGYLLCLNKRQWLSLLFGTN